MRTLLAVLLALVSPAALAATTYYVRSDGGACTSSTVCRCTGKVDAADTGSGQNQNCAWKSPADVYLCSGSGTDCNGDGVAELEAGDSVLFRRGDTWRGYGLGIDASGTVGSPITIGAYGTGNPPVLDAWNSTWTWTNVGQRWQSVVPTNEWPNTSGLTYAFLLGGIQISRVASAAEVDSPMEWFYDNSTNTFYVYSWDYDTDGTLENPDAEFGTGNVSLALADTLFQSIATAGKPSYIVIEGLDFVHIGPFGIYQKNTQTNWVIRNVNVSCATCGADFATAVTTGVYLLDTGVNTSIVENSTITGCGYGLWTASSADIAVKNTLITGNGKNGVYAGTAATAVDLSYSHVAGNGAFSTYTSPNNGDFEGNKYTDSGNNQSRTTIVGAYAPQINVRKPIATISFDDYEFQDLRRPWGVAYIKRLSALGIPIQWSMNAETAEQTAQGAAEVKKFSDAGATICSHGWSHPYISGSTDGGVNGKALLYLRLTSPAAGASVTINQSGTAYNSTATTMVLKEGGTLLYTIDLVNGGVNGNPATCPRCWDVSDLVAWIDALPNWTATQTDIDPPPLGTGLYDGNNQALSKALDATTDATVNGGRTLSATKMRHQYVELYESKAWLEAATGRPVTCFFPSFNDRDIDSDMMATSLGYTIGRGGWATNHYLVGSSSDMRGHNSWPGGGFSRFDLPALGFGRGFNFDTGGNGKMEESERPTAAALDTAARKFALAASLIDVPVDIFHHIYEMDWDGDATIESWEFEHTADIARAVCKYFRCMSVKDLGTYLDSLPTITVPYTSSSGFSGTIKVHSMPRAGDAVSSILRPLPGGSLDGTGNPSLTTSDIFNNTPRGTRDIGAVEGKRAGSR